MNGTFDPNSYDAVVAEIRTDLKAMRAQQLSNSEKLDKALDRIGALERFKYWIIGLGAAAGGATSKIMSLIKGNPNP